MREGDFFVKNRKRSRKYLYIEAMIALIIVLSCALFKYTSVVQEIAVNQCFSVLDDSQEQIGQMIANEMKNEQGHLELASQNRAKARIAANHFHRKK